MCGGKVAIPPVVKEKRRNSEKRKEKSRDAARCRRSKESEIFSDLQSRLPVSDQVAKNLDKASVMRLTIATLKVRDMIHSVLHKRTASRVEEEENGQDQLCPDEALDGFLLVVSEEGDMLFISEKVEDILGMHYSEMMGHPLCDFLHPCDHQEVESLLLSSASSEHIDLFLRFKSSLKTKGKTLHLKHNSHRVIHCVGHRYARPSDQKKSCSFYILFIGTPLPHPAQVDVALSDTAIFVSRHSPDMKFTHIDEKISGFLGYKSSELIGQSVYCFHHVQDAERMLSSFKILLCKGQVETGPYRFLARHGGHVWLLTQATLICDNSQRPECVVCLNYVLTKVEQEELIVSEHQEEKAVETIAIEEPQKEEVDRSSLSTTGAIFSRKPVMSSSKQFLNFPDTDILLFQGEKDSKLHLDLDLFSDDGIEDPFSYREESLSSPSGTPESSMHLPLSTSTSPDRCCFPDTPDSGSLSDIPSLDPIDSFSNLRFTMPTHNDKEDYEEDLDFRAPFIPMQMDDDFPLLSPSNSVMWGPQEPPPARKHQPQDRLSELEHRPSLKQKIPLNENSLKSSLAALLQSDTNNKKSSNNNNNRHNNNNNNKRWHADTTKARQRNNHFTPSRNYPSGGHIIMLDSIPPVKKPSQQSAAAKPGQRRGQTGAAGANSGPSPSIGSHTSTVRVNDRLIKVQVSVSELPSVPIEQKQPFPSPPDPPPKRSPPPSTDSPKRIRLDSTQQGSPSGSVLLNLLISGEDASRGYLCSGNSRQSESKFEPAVLSLPANDRLDLSSNDLLSTENDLLLDNYLKIQYEDYSDELLSALDHPLLRNSVASSALG